MTSKVETASSHRTLEALTRTPETRAPVAVAMRHGVLPRQRHARPPSSRRHVAFFRRRRRVNPLQEKGAEGHTWWQPGADGFGREWKKLAISRHTWIRCASLGEGDSYNGASAVSSTWEHEPWPSTRETTTWLSLFIHCLSRGGFLRKYQDGDGSQKPVVCDLMSM